MTSDKGSILIVDDEPEVRDTLREYFELCGFDVYVAGDGDGMRKVLERRRVDVVLMDLNLPGEDGLALTRQLRDSHGMGIINVQVGRNVLHERATHLERAAAARCQQSTEPPPPHINCDGAA